MPWNSPWETKQVIEWNDGNETFMVPKYLTQLNKTGTLQVYNLINSVQYGKSLFPVCYSLN